MTITDKTNQYIYDAVPYPSFSFHVSHPDRLATLATLLGMRPPPVENCRVLELGCAAGGNLIPMAQSLPESELVGIDLSARHIAEGQAMLAAVGLKNVTLQHMNILDVDADFGQPTGSQRGFDYIIAHGIYSWVPPEVQEKVLEICKQNLSPNGVAYVSYNTYPGWHMLKALREMMRFHTRGLTDPKEQASQARALLEFLADSEPVEKSPHASFFKAFVSYTKERLLPRNDAFLIHDELAEFNEPIYFYQFVEQAEQHGLQYLAEADFQTMLASNLPDGVAETLRQMAADTVALEQYMDFLRNRTFRQTLLCHQDIQLTGSPHPDLLANFYVGSPALPVASELDVLSRQVEEFRSPDGAIFSTDHPITKAGMFHLTRIWPHCIPFKTLLATARAELNGTASDITSDAQVLGAGLLKAYGYSDNLVELHVYEPNFVLGVSECPVVSPVARFQAMNGSTVTNLRHERIHLAGPAYHLLCYLDGSRDRPALLSVLEGLAAEGVVALGQAGEPAETVERTEQSPEPDEGGVLAEVLDSSLHQLARAALLVR